VCTALQLGWRRRATLAYEQNDVIHKTGSTQCIDTPPEEERAMVIFNMHKKFGEDRTCSFENVITDRRRQTGTLITVGSRVKVQLVAVKTMLAHTTVPPVIVMCLLIVHSSWSRFLAVRPQVTWVVNPTVGCHYFPPGLQLPLQPLRLCYQFRCLANIGTMGANSLPKTVTRQRHSSDLNSRPAVPESSTLTTRLPSHLWL